MTHLQQMRWSLRDPNAHDPARPTTEGAARTASALVLADPVHGSSIATHPLYGAATPAVGHAWALPRSHPLWRPMDFEVPDGAAAGGGALVTRADAEARAEAKARELFDQKALGGYSSLRRRAILTRRVLARRVSSTGRRPTRAARGRSSLPSSSQPRVPSLLRATRRRALRPRRRPRHRTARRTGRAAAAPHFCHRRARARSRARARGTSSGSGRTGRAARGTLRRDLLSSRLVCDGYNQD